MNSGISTLYFCVIISVMVSLVGCDKPYVRLTKVNVSYGDLDGNMKIETSSATYFFREQGGGFTGIIDRDGKDWIGHNNGKGPIGQWRGIPNTNIAGWRPEKSGSKTKIILQTPDKLVLSCEKGGYECTWTFFPDHATMNVLKADSNYYFSYEGAPNGKFDTITSYFFRPDLNKRYFMGRTSPETDIKMLPSENYEWCYFGDTNTKHAFYMVHHEDDSIPDYYRPMNGMTVYGFGRTGKSNENLTKVPQHFSIGFCADTTFYFISNSIRKIVKETKNQH